MFQGGCSRRVLLVRRSGASPLRWVHTYSRHTHTRSIDQTHAGIGTQQCLAPTTGLSLYRREQVLRGWKIFAPNEKNNPPSPTRKNTVLTAESGERRSGWPRDRSEPRGGRCTRRRTGCQLRPRRSRKPMYVRVGGIKRMPVAFLSGMLSLFCDRRRPELVSRWLCQREERPTSWMLGRRAYVENPQ